jgi:hypothetical protein
MRTLENYSNWELFDIAWNKGTLSGSSDGGFSHTSANALEAAADISMITAFVVARRNSEQGNVECKNRLLD